MMGKGAVICVAVMGLGAVDAAVTVPRCVYYSAVHADVLIEGVGCAVARASCARLLQPCATDLTVEVHTW